MNFQYPMQHIQQIISFFGCFWYNSSAQLSCSVTYIFFSWRHFYWSHQLLLHAIIFRVGGEYFVHVDILHRVGSSSFAGVSDLASPSEGLLSAYYLFSLRFVLFIHRFWSVKICTKKSKVSLKSRVFFQIVFLFFT